MFDPREKSAPRKNFENLFWLETSKKDHSRGGSEVAIALVLKSMCPSTSQRCSFIPRSAFFSPKIPYCFPELFFRLPKVTSILDNLKISKWSMIFYLFYSNFSPHDSLEDAVSEHLEWLKFPSPKHSQREVTAPP